MIQEEELEYIIQMVWLKSSILLDYMEMKILCWRNNVNKSTIHVHLIINLLNGGQLLRQLLEVGIILT